MAGRRGSPTLRRRQLGIELRSLREAAGVTIDQVAERLGFSASKVSRIESAKTGVATRDVLGFAKVYGVPAERVEALVQMAREANRRGGGSSTVRCSPPGTSASRPRRTRSTHMRRWWYLASCRPKTTLGRQSERRATTSTSRRLKSESVSE